MEQMEQKKKAKMVSVEREFEGRNTFAPSINKKSQKLAEAHKAKKEAAEEKKDNTFIETNT